MTNNKNENLNELLIRFYGSAEAEKVKNDIKTGDELFASFSVPSPSESLLNNIKAEADRKASRKTHMAHYYKLAAVAALILVIISLLPLIDSAKKRETAIISDAIPHNTNIFNETSKDLAVFAEELENIETDILAVQLDEINTGNGYMAEYIEDMETQLTEIETIFWKG